MDIHVAPRIPPMNLVMVFLSGFMSRCAVYRRFVKRALNVFRFLIRLIRSLLWILLQTKYQSVYGISKGGIVGDNKSSFAPVFNNVYKQIRISHGFSSITLK